MSIFLGAIKGKKTIVKSWYGKSNDDSKATYREFASVKEAKKFIKDSDKLYNKKPIYGNYQYDIIVN